MTKGILGLLLNISFLQVVFCQGNALSEKLFPLTSIENLQLINVKGEIVDHHGKNGLRVTSIDRQSIEDYETLVLLPEISFKNGIIELEISGEPAPGAFAQARGFVGLAFRVDKTHIEKYECFYIRPANGRADNQIQRNHSIQYISHPEFPWYRLREEAPEAYESYVDLVPGNWTKIKIEVMGSTAKLFVHDSEQPNLIVNDLKHGVSEGAIALWLHSSTLAHFRNLVIRTIE